MVRFTQVQSFSGDAQQAAPIQYEAATGGVSAESSEVNKTGVRVAVVKNVSSSGAGVGSSAFHIYRKERRSEQERLEHLAEQQTKMVADQLFKEKLEANEKESELLTKKKAEKRKKRLQNFKAKKAKQENESEDDEDEDSNIPIIVSQK